MDKKKDMSGCAHLGENARESEWRKKERINKRRAHFRMNLVVGGVYAEREGKEESQWCHPQLSSARTRYSVLGQTHCDARSVPSITCLIKRPLFIIKPTMDPLPISPYTINLILHYIYPPSQLSTPIPSHLLSRSLLQRHTLLEISPEDPSSYLCWPSSTRDRAIQYLESLPMPLDELAPDFLVGYTLDPEHTYAHVQVKPAGDDGLRLVFEWDGEGSWKYHDSNVMPFPPATRPTLEEAVPGSPSVSIPVPQFDGQKQDKGGKGEGDNDDDADYWNSYGAADDGGTLPLQSSTKDETDASEDAYWAQYASVQGMGMAVCAVTLHSQAASSEHTRLQVQPTPPSHHPYPRERLSRTIFHMKKLSPSVMRIPGPAPMTQRVLHLRPP